MTRPTWSWADYETCKRDAAAQRTLAVETREDAAPPETPAQPGGGGVAPAAVPEPVPAPEESPAMRRARELLGMGIHINDVLGAVKLSKREQVALGVEARAA